MADKLDWLNKHLIFLRYTSVKQAVDEEKYQIPPHLVEMFAGTDSGEEMVYKLAKGGKYKEACELLSYVAHRRAAVWWGYRCVTALLEELKENPPEDRDIDDIGKSAPLNVPDFAKVKLPDPPDTSPLDKAIAGMSEKTKAMRDKADPKMQKLVEDAVEVAFQEFKRVNGMHPVEMVQKLGALMAQDRTPIDPASPVFKARDELRAKIEAVRKDTIDTIKSVIPPKVPDRDKKIRDNALDAVYRWVAAPTDLTSKMALEVGNQCPDTPAGMLSLSAFWASGNLMPGADQIVPVPPGLAANGVVQSLLMCALSKGGTRKVKERYEQYFNLGVDVLSGKDNWESSLAAGVAPHQEIPQAPSSPGAAPQTPASGYQRWKPTALR